MTDSFRYVASMRWEQENKLSQTIRRQQNANAELTENKPLGVMTREQLDMFLMHYERITTHILDTMPKAADCLMELDVQRNIDLKWMN